MERENNISFIANYPNPNAFVEPLRVAIHEESHAAGAESVGSIVAYKTAKPDGTTRGLTITKIQAATPYEFLYNAMVTAQSSKEGEALCDITDHRGCAHDLGQMDQYEEWAALLFGKETARIMRQSAETHARNAVMNIGKEGLIRRGLTLLKQSFGREISVQSLTPDPKPIYLATPIAQAA